MFTSLEGDFSYRKYESSSLLPESSEAALLFNEAPFMQENKFEGFYIVNDFSVFKVSEKLKHFYYLLHYFSILFLF